MTTSQTTDTAAAWPSALAAFARRRAADPASGAPAGEPAQSTQRGSSGRLLGRLDRRSADRRPAALGHVRRLAVRRADRQGRLADRVRRALRRLPHRSRATYYEFPTDADGNDPRLRRDPVLQLGLRVDPRATRTIPAFQLADIANGTYDSYIREFAEAARDWGHPFFLRFDWEMNGDWFPWSEGVNGNQPGDYVAAWRHVHDIFTAVGATNATWVWCPYADPKPARTARALLPRRRLRRLDLPRRLQLGHERRQLRSPGSSFDKIFASTYRKIVSSIAPRKPMMLAELASDGAASAKATWIGRMFRTPARPSTGGSAAWSGSTRSTAASSGRSRPRRPALRAFRSGVNSARLQANLYSG